MYVDFKQGVTNSYFERLTAGQTAPALTAYGVLTMYSGLIMHLILKSIRIPHQNTDIRVLNTGQRTIITMVITKHL